MDRESSEVLCRLSVVMGTLNRLDVLRKSIESLLRETQVEFLLYIADAGSTDGTVDYLKRIACDKIVPILAGRKLGQAKAYNDIFKMIATPYVAWLSDDNELVNGGLDVAIGILDREPTIGMVGLKTRDVRGPFVRAPYIGGISSVGILNVNQGVLRTDVLRSVGYFSEYFGFYGIDPDLTAKVLLGGNDVVYTKVVAIHHHRDWEEENPAAYAARGANQERSRRIYLAKYSSVLRNSVGWSVKRRVAKMIRNRVSPNFWNSSRPVISALPRDWYNALNCRFISAWDPLIHLKSSYHLRQHYSGRRVCIPSDPIDS